MSAADSSASPQQCACTNIHLMQLFHELKQKFPQVPDHVVNDTINEFCHNKDECEKKLEKEAKASLLHSYHAKSISKVKQKADDSIKSVSKVCPNQNNNNTILKSKNIAVKPTECDANKEITINLDSCEVIQTQSDIESAEDEPVGVVESQLLDDAKQYKIEKSSKILTGLNKKLLNEILDESKPTRPTSLEFNKSTNPEEITRKTEAPSIWFDNLTPLNVSVNVNCHMDLTPISNSHTLSCRTELLGSEEVIGSPRSITSVNLTITTPPSSMQHHSGDLTDESGRSGFQGQVTVTVSPSSGKTPPIRKAPLPPIVAPLRPAPPPPNRIQGGLPARTPEIIVTAETSLIARQKERLSRLQHALNSSKAQLVKLTQETEILIAPLPSAESTQRLRVYVKNLSEMCDTMAKRLDHDGTTPPANVSTSPFNEAEETPSWQCHVCTFRNHGLLNKCEECDMPRIVVKATAGNDDLRGINQTNVVVNQAEMPSGNNATMWML